MNFQQVSFELSAGKASQLPRPSCRKSFFPENPTWENPPCSINWSTGRRWLGSAPRPARLQPSIFSGLPDCRLVDLPGYGYAKVSQSEKKRWAELVEGYFAQNRNIRLVIQLLDMRHAPTEEDRGMVEFLLEQEIPFLAVCTKADKLNKTKQHRTVGLLSGHLFRDRCNGDALFFPDGRGSGRAAGLY